MNKMSSGNSMIPDLKKKKKVEILTVPKLRHYKTVLLNIMNTRQVSVFFSTRWLGLFPYFGCSVNSVAMASIGHPFSGALNRFNIT